MEREDTDRLCVLRRERTNLIFLCFFYTMCYMLIILSIQNSFLKSWKAQEDRSDEITARDVYLAIFCMKEKWQLKC